MMKVREVVAKLLELDQDLPVFACGHCCSDEVVSVSVVDYVGVTQVVEISSVF